MLRIFLSWVLILLLSIINNSYSSVIYLSDDFQTSSTILTQHIKTTVPYLLETVDKKNSRNYMRVALYAYEPMNARWYYKEDSDTYMSSWNYDNKNLDYKNCITLGKSYGNGTEKNFNDLKQNEKERLQKDFFQRGKCGEKDQGINIKNFSEESYCHSEQSFISMLQKRILLKEKPDDLSYFQQFLVLLVSTNEPCSKCEPTLLYLLKNNELAEFLPYFKGTWTKLDEEKLVEEKTVNKKNFTTNILYEYLRIPEKISFLDTNDSSFLYLHPGLKFN